MLLSLLLRVTNTMKLSLKYLLVLSVVAIASQSSVVVFADYTGDDEGMSIFLL